MILLLVGVALCLVHCLAHNTDPLNASCAGSPPSIPNRLITFVCVHDTGHLRALSPLVEHLVQQGNYRIQFALVEDVQHVAKETGAEYVPAGKIKGGMAWETIETAKAFDPTLNPWAALERHARTFRVRAEVMVKPLLEAFIRDRPDLVVCDMLTSACFDVSEKLGIPFIFFGASSLPAVDLGWGLPSGIFSPNNAYVPFQDMVTVMPQDMSILQRVQGFVLKALVAPIPTRYFSYVRNTHRTEVLDLPPVRSYCDWSYLNVPPLLMIASSIGFDYAQPLDPHVFYVGAFLKESTDRLTDEMKSWLDSKPIVIYVSHGTVVDLSASAIENYVRGFERLRGNISVLWSLKANLWSRLPKALPDNIRFEKFVPQQAVLKHPNVKIFVSHCGGASVMESAVAGVPMILAPEGADQPVNAQKAFDAGWGLILTHPHKDRGVVSPDLLVAHIETILKDPSFKQKVTVGGKQVIAAGGLKKATELIEMAIDIGWDHLVPAVHFQPWWKQLVLDVYLVIFGAVFILYSSCCKCFSCHKKKATLGK